VFCTSLLINVPTMRPDPAPLPRNPLCADSEAGIGHGDMFQADAVIQLEQRTLHIAEVPFTCGEIRGMKIDRRNAVRISQAS